MFEELLIRQVPIAQEKHTRRYQLMNLLSVNSGNLEVLSDNVPLSSGLHL